MPVRRKLRPVRAGQGSTVEPVKVVIAKKRGYGGKAKKPYKGFSAVQSKTIARAIGHREETKYFAQQLAENLALDPAIHTMGTDVLPLAPVITVGTGEHQRVGRQCQPFKNYIDVVATFNQQSINSNPAIVTAREIYVAMYILAPKQQKTWTQYQADGDNLLQLLDNGDGTAVQFGAPDGSGGYTTNTKFLSYPIESTRHRLIRKKVIKLVRNDGGMNTGTTPNTSTNLTSSVWKGRFYFRLPKLTYDDSASSTLHGYPANTCPVMMFGYANADNGTTIQPDPGYNALSITARLHCWFKDS